MARVCFPVFHTGNNQFLFSRCKLCLYYTTGNFNQNPRMRTVAKILRARASEHSSNFLGANRAKAKFCEHFQIGWDHSIPLNNSKNYKSSLFSILNSNVYIPLLSRSFPHFSSRFPPTRWSGSSAKEYSLVT